VDEVDAGVHVRSRIVQLAANLRPVAGMREALLRNTPDHDQQDARSHVAGGEVDFRVVLSPKRPGIAPGTHLWAVVEKWPDGHEEFLVIGHAPSAEAAALAGLPHYTKIRDSRKG
jgi:hypothetical protein